MFFGSFDMQITNRGATNIDRLSPERRTHFDYEGKRWVCLDPQRRLMTNELADGYEMSYCVARYCERLAA